MRESLLPPPRKYDASISLEGVPAVHVGPRLTGTLMSAPPGAM